VWWRRALDPDFDPEAVLPIFMDITRHMLCGRSQEPAEKQTRVFDIKESVR
jgi:TetR/AcrR family transcriptional repressor of uid operon